MSVPEYRRFAELRLDALNHALRTIPPDRVRFHMCWGSYHGPHRYDIPLRDIVDLVLKVRAGAYSIEASNPCHQHEWRGWGGGEMPPGASIAPGGGGPDTRIFAQPRAPAPGPGEYARRVAPADAHPPTPPGGVPRVRLPPP